MRPNNAAELTVSDAGSGIRRAPVWRGPEKSSCSRRPRDKAFPVDAEVLEGASYLHAPVLTARKLSDEVNAPDRISDPAAGFDGAACAARQR
jgi:hypothetical protein